MQSNETKVRAISTLTAAAALLILFLTSSCGYRDMNLAAQLSMTADDMQTSDKISAHELHRLLSDHFGRVFIKLSDAKYTLPDNAEVAELSRISGKDDWNGGDYAIAAMVPLRNYAFGAMYITGEDGGRQVTNVFVNRNREVVRWEARERVSYSGHMEKPELIVF